MTVHHLDRGYTPPPPSDGGDGMDTRVTKLETRIDTILPTLATKGDVSEAKADIIKWGSGIAFAMTAIIIAVLGFLINRISPPQAPQQQQSPIIIYPQQQPPTQPAPQSPPATKRGQQSQLP